jgi:hypothetical protein
VIAGAKPLPEIEGERAHRRAPFLCILFSRTTPQ